MAALASVAGLAKNKRLRKAICRHRMWTADGLSERLFGLMFSGLVYPQIWEDPDVDMEAMALGEGHRVVTIASGGCNLLSYLSARPAALDAVDLNPAHVALNRLKTTAMRHLPSHGDFLRFFGSEGIRHNTQAYDRFVAPHLDPATRRYWDSRDWRGRRRITVFNRNFCRTGLLGRFIAAAHAVARLHGVDPSELTRARCLREQRQYFERELAPLFDRPLIRFLTRRKASLYGLGIPPAQYDGLSEGNPGTLAATLRQRLEKLACHFPLEDNYFAWQAFGRRYPSSLEGRLPPYLCAENYEAIRGGLDAVRIHHASFTELLARKPAGSVDRYVLLDAQDWMTDAQLNALWTEIDRTSSIGARVIFRTAGAESILEGRVSAAILSKWTYHAEPSRDFARRDRSAIYGGFHLYERNA